MPRSIWSGSISFGLVNVPVKVYSAMRQRDLRFHQFDPETDSRIRYRRVSEKTGEEVPSENIVKGYELARGRYVTFEPEELEAFEPKATRTIDIEDFVALEEIDPVYYEQTYWLAPDGGEGGARAYALLRKAMEDQDKVGIGRVVMRTKEYLAAIRPREGALAMSTMLFHDEVIPAADIDELDAEEPDVPAKQVKMATQIVESLTTPWEPERYRDTYREQVLEWLEKKAEGEELVVEEEAEEPKVVDLTAALEASLEAARKGQGKGSAGGRQRGARSRRSSGEDRRRKSA